MIEKIIIKKHDLIAKLKLAIEEGDSQEAKEVSKELHEIIHQSSCYETKSKLQELTLDKKTKKGGSV